MRFAAYLFFLLPWYVLAGCGPTPPVTHVVTGTITFDGEPVADGEIKFIPQDKVRGLDAGPIKGGKFSVAVKDGKHTVAITGGKMTPFPPGKKGLHGETEMMRNFIPEKYNEHSELTAEVAGPKELNFELKSK